MRSCPPDEKSRSAFFQVVSTSSPPCRLLTLAHVQVRKYTSFPTQLMAQNDPGDGMTGYVMTTRSAAPSATMWGSSAGRSCGSVAGAKRTFAYATAAGL